MHAGRALRTLAMLMVSCAPAAALVEIAVPQHALLTQLHGLHAAVAANEDGLLITLDGGEGNADEELLSTLQMPERAEMLKTEAALRLAMQESSAPIIAVADGPLSGAAAAIFLSAPQRVCTENTVLTWESSAKNGLCPSFGALNALATMPQPHVAMACALGALRLSACDVMELRLATHYVPSGSLAAMAEELHVAPSEFLDIPLDRRGTTGAAPKTLVPLYASGKEG